MQIQIQIRNLDQVKEGLKKAPLYFARHIDKAIKRSILLIERGSKPLTPVDTGRLRGSYQSSFQLLRGVLDVNTSYAYWVHEGTSRMLARPFLENGIDKSNSDIEKSFEKAVEDSLNDIANSVNKGIFA